MKFFLDIFVSKRFARSLPFVVSVLLLTLSAAVQGMAQDDPAGAAVAVFQQAQNAHEAGDLAEARRLYERALTILPEFPEAQYQRGVVLLATGELAAAEISFRRALELREDWPVAMSSLGSLLVARGKFAEAESVLKRVLDLQPNEPQAISALVDLRLRTNAPASALQALLAVVIAATGKSKPHVAIWTARSALESALGMRPAAKESIAKALAADPADRSALLLAADIALAESDIRRARQIAADLAAIEGGSDRVLLLNADILAADARPRDALAELSKIRSPSEAATELRSKLETSLATSAATLEAQLAKDANNVLVLSRLCSLLRKENPVKALEYCRRASETEPNNVEHAVGFGAALVQARQYGPAVELFRKLLQIAPDNSTAHANLATALFQMKRYPEAKTEFIWLTEAQPKSAGAYYFLGVIHDQLDEYLDAMANYQQYLRLANPIDNRDDIERVKLRLPGLEKQIKQGKGKRN